MTHVVVTIETESKERSDLALPLDVPGNILAAAVAEAISIEKDRKHDYTLYVKTEHGLTRLPAQTSLADMAVLDGTVLVLSLDSKNPSENPTPTGHAMLVPEQGRPFLLEAKTNLIGRTDVKRGHIVDIDLSQLDSQKISSRSHARILKQGKTWALAEDSRCRNGTWLNGHRITPEESYPLQDGDEIIFGRNGVLLKFNPGR